MAAPFDYTQPNIPANAFLFQQGQQLPPDVAQQNIQMQSPDQLAAMQNTSGVPAYLTQNPNAPDLTTPPDGLDSYLHMNQAVKPYSPANRQDPMFAAYDRMAKTAGAEQWAGINQIQKYIEDMKGQPSGINWSPLAAYVDANDPTGKSHLEAAAQAMAPMTPEQKQKQIMDLQLKLQGDRNSMSKDQLAALGQQITMQKNAQMMEHNMNMDRSNDIRAQSYADRANQGFDNQSMHANDVFDKNPLLLQARARYNQISVDRHTLESATVVPQQMMSEMAAGLATAISGSKAAGLEQTRMQELHSLEGDVAKIQSYAGKPLNSLQPEQRKFLLDTFDRLSGAYQRVMADTYTAIRRGRNYRYNPAANTAMDVKGVSYGVQPGSFDPMGTSAGPAGSIAAPTGAAPPDYHSLSDDALYEQWKARGSR